MPASAPPAVFLTALAGILGAVPILDIEIVGGAASPSLAQDLAPTRRGASSARGPAGPGCACARSPPYARCAAADLPSSYRDERAWWTRRGSQARSSRPAPSLPWKPRAVQYGPRPARIVGGAHAGRRATSCAASLGRRRAPTFGVANSRERDAAAEAHRADRDRVPTGGEHRSRSCSSRRLIEGRVTSAGDAPWGIILHSPNPYLVVGLPAFPRTGDGFAWEIPAGPMTIRYNAVVKDGTWTEVGDRVAPGKEPVRFFEMSSPRGRHRMAGRGVPRDRAAGWWR